MAHTTDAAHAVAEAHRNSNPSSTLQFLDQLETQGYEVVKVAGSLARMPEHVGIVHVPTSSWNAHVDEIQALRHLLRKAEWRLRHYDPNGSAKVADEIKEELGQWFAPLPGENIR